MSSENFEEKPSFFDSQDESTSWPPKDEYEVEAQQAPKPSEQDFFDEDIINESDDFLDDLLSDSDSNTFTASESGMRIVDDEVDELSSEAILERKNDNFLDDYVLESNDFEEETQDSILDSDPIGKQNFEIETFDQEVSSSDLDNIFTIDSPESYDSNLNSDIETENAVLDDFEKTSQSDDIDLDDFLNDSSQEEIIQEQNNYDEMALGAAAAIAFDDVVDDAKDFDEDYGFDQARESSIGIVDDDYSYSDNLIDDIPKPFRTFTKINLANELAEEAQEEEEKAGVLAGMNRNILIIIVIVLLSLGFFIFNTFFNRKIETKSRTKRKAPVKEKIAGRVEQVLAPVWEISDQYKQNPESEDNYAKSLVKFTGRENPFAMPQSVINALKRQADLEILSKKKPNTYERTAYRSTLLGVLTSEDSTIALVDVQQATFDIIEGTTKAKILSLATKSMSKATKDTLEMTVGNYIGPWQIIDVSAPKGTFAEAKITIEYQGTRKVLNMGKAEDLGIFDPVGQIDDLEEKQEGVPLGSEFIDDEFDDDF